MANNELLRFYRSRSSSPADCFGFEKSIIMFSSNSLVGKSPFRLHDHYISGRVEAQMWNELKHGHQTSRIYQSWHYQINLADSKKKYFSKKIKRQKLITDPDWRIQNAYVEWEKFIVVLNIANAFYLPSYVSHTSYPRKIHPTILQGSAILSILFSSFKWPVLSTRDHINWFADNSTLHSGQNYKSDRPKHQAQADALNTSKTQFFWICQLIWLDHFATVTARR